MAKAKEAVRAWGQLRGGVLQPIAERNGPTPRDLLPKDAISVPVEIRLLRAARPKRKAKRNG